MKPRNLSKISLRKILLTLVDPIHALPYLKLVAALLHPQGRVLALKIVRIPHEESLSIGAEIAPIYRAAMEATISPT
jgi:hypothetical protein